MDPYQLSVLRELGDHGSVAATARALGVSPSAVSQSLAALQRKFKAPLTQKRGGDPLNSLMPVRPWR